MLPLTTYSIHYLNRRLSRNLLVLLHGLNAAWNVFHEIFSICTVNGSFHSRKILSASDFELNWSFKANSVPFIGQFQLKIAFNVNLDKQFKCWTCTSALFCKNHKQTSVFTHLGSKTQMSASFSCMMSSSSHKISLIKNASLLFYMLSHQRVLLQ